MKNIITILIMFVAVGCSKSLKEEDVVGSYERKEDEHTFKVVLLENGKVGDSHNWPLAVWKILEKEVHIVLEPDAKYVEVFKIEPNGDLIYVSETQDGKRTDFPKEDQRTFKKVKSNVEKLKAENERLEAELKEKQRKLEAESSLREARAERIATAKNKRLKEDLLKLSVVGSYEIKKGEETFKLVFLKNGKSEFWDGEKKDDGTWKIDGKEVHIIDEEGTSVFKIETNGDLTVIADIDQGSGKRTEFSNKSQNTLKKLKE